MQKLKRKTYVSRRGLFHLAAASVRSNRPRNGGIRGRGRLWVVPRLFFGSAGLGRSLKLFALVVKADKVNNDAAAGEPLGRVKTSLFRTRSGSGFFDRSRSGSGRKFCFCLLVSLFLQLQLRLFSLLPGPPCFLRSGFSGGHPLGVFGGLGFGGRSGCLLRDVDCHLFLRHCAVPRIYFSSKVQDCSEIVAECSGITGNCCRFFRNCRGMFWNC